jgi:hypothetical protein
MHVSPELAARIEQDRRSLAGWICSTNCSMKAPRRNKEEEQQFKELAALCGIRMDKLGKRKRRGYRQRPIKAFT